MKEQLQQCEATLDPPLFDYTSFGVQVPFEYVCHYLQFLY
jgi:hypothetical protein